MQPFMQNETDFTEMFKEFKRIKITLQFCIAVKHF